MKIALVSSSYHPYYKGGGEYSVKYLAEGLARQGEDVFVITAYRQTQTETVDGIKVYRIKHPNVYWSYESDQQPPLKKLLWHIVEAYNFRVTARVKGLLARERPDVLHIRNTEDFSPYLAKVAYELGIPVVVTLNSYTWLCPRATMFRHGTNCATQCGDCKLLTRPKKHLSRYVNTVVGVSQFIVDTHRRYHYFPQATSEVVYTSPPASPVLPVREGCPLTFGYIGRVHPTKGVLDVIRAFIALPGDYRLLIAGEGPPEYVAQCQQLAGEDRRVSFLGQYEASQFYQDVDLVIISSQWREPFPRVLVEAYAFGKPVVATTTGGTREMIQPGRTGFIYDPTEAGSLAETMRVAAWSTALERRTMQKHIETFVRDKLPDDIQRYRTIYRALLP